MVGFELQMGSDVEWDEETIEEFRQKLQENNIQAGSIATKECDSYIQETVERVDKKLQDALELANTYSQHEEVRPSAVMAFDKIEEAREELDKIDQREFNSE